MRVNLGRGDIAMTKELLDRADIVAVFKKLRRKTLSQRVGGSMLRDLRPLNSFLYGLLNPVLSALAAANPYFHSLEIQIFHPQSQTLQQSKS